MRAAIEATVTIRPYRRRRMAGATARQARNVAVRFAATTLFHSSRPTSGSGPAPEKPAGAGHQDVQAPRAVEDRSHRGDDVGLVGRVADEHLDVPSGPPGRRRHGGRPVRVAVEEQHVRPGHGQPLDADPPDTRASIRDQGDLVAQWQVRLPRFGPGTHPRTSSSQPETMWPTSSSRPL